MLFLTLNHSKNNGIKKKTANLKKIPKCTYFLCIRTEVAILTAYHRSHLILLFRASIKRCLFRVSSFQIFARHNRVIIACSQSSSSLFM